MATLIEIAEAIKSIEQKRESLKKSFEELQNHSNYLSSFTLTWPQIDTHFSQIQSSLQSRFSLLQQSPSNSDHNPENPSPQNLLILEKIKEMCQKMEAQNLRNWVQQNCNPKFRFVTELGLGLTSAPDPYKLVLDGLERVYPKGKWGLVFLEGLMMVKGVKLREEERERAKKLSVVWREKIGTELNKFPFEVLGLLSLLSCFGLVEEFGKEEAIELVYIVANNAKAPKICRSLGLEERASDLVEKLINNGKQHMAIKFVYEFKLQTKFPPAALLKTYLRNATKAANKLHRKGKNAPQSFDQANEKELSALRTVLNCIGAYKLASQYPPERIEKRIKTLEELKAKGKSSADTQPFNPRMSKQKSLKQPLQSRGNRPEAHTNYSSAAAIHSSMNLTYLPSQQHYMGPPISHPYVSGSELPPSSSNMPIPVVTFGFPPLNPASHP